MDAGGIQPLTSTWSTTKLKPLNHEDLLMSRAPFFHVTALATLNFGWTCNAVLYANIPSRHFQSVQAFFKNLVPPRSCFSSAAARKTHFLSESL
jgi:hypothetical protein